MKGGERQGREKIKTAGLRSMELKKIKMCFVPVPAPHNGYNYYVMSTQANKNKDKFKKELCLQKDYTLDWRCDLNQINKNSYTFNASKIYICMKIRQKSEVGSHLRMLSSPKECIL